MSNFILEPFLWAKGNHFLNLLCLCEKMATKITQNDICSLLYEEMMKSYQLNQENIKKIWSLFCWSDFVKRVKFFNTVIYTNIKKKTSLKPVSFKVYNIVRNANFFILSLIFFYLYTWAFNCGTDYYLILCNSSYWHSGYINRAP